ncbi:AcrB/AcrD/AcrF family protein [Thalassococcus profundi]|uniref:AcrB/AcrD/AcrF family protein n=1 Tax=Thalassococcus profundi TaxID=2282382 RepID=A0A369TR35_9RHOB|nr:efflux RND transporter permease subunit [Thalassococcus profundi]RDD67731.1 AcrB/AcrD/AcrF family protein [Thalassococcus profundi]
MGIARASIEKSLLTWILMLGCLLGGVWGFFDVGRLEDPAFTIKEAVVVTRYPGASAAQVAVEVSEPLESAIQQMGEVDTIRSTNRPGLSTINVEIKSTFGGDELPAIWTKLRARIRDAARDLPAGAQEPLVNDSFGDVFGIFYAITAEGFSDAEKHRIATFLRRELLAVDGVADVETQGLPPEAIFVEPSLALTYNLGVPPGVIAQAVSDANMVSQAGSVQREGRRIDIQAPEGTDSVDDIAGLSIGVGGEVVNLFDIAQVVREREAYPQQIIRFNGQEAFTLGVAGLSSENIVEVGQRVDARLAALEDEIPVGVELMPIYQQHEVVDEASNAFLVNLAMSVAIVVLVLAVAMGWRAAVVVGTTLLLTVVGTLFFMAIFAIEMERISLGALIIAMGMLVDNAIVVAEGMQIKMAQGMKSRDAADDVGGKTQIPLLGATVIGIMAFAGIGLSPDATGEFLFSLFAVIGISLLLSWVLAITATPLLGHYLFKVGSGDGQHDAYGGSFFRAYAAILRGALRVRLLVVAALIGVTVACYIGFGLISQQFFPNSNTPLFYAHLTLPQGTPIHQTADELAKVEAWLAEREDAVSVASFIGQGATRFMLTYGPEEANPGYGLLIIRTETIEEIPALRQDLIDFAAEALPAGLFRTERLVFGPGGGAPIAARFSGPDPVVLRQLAEEAAARMSDASDNLRHLRTNWREQELVMQPIFATERAQTAGIERQDIADVLQFATDGTRAGEYREGERLIPIIVREQPDEADLISQVVYSDAAEAFVPLEQVIDGFRHVPQDTLIHRRDRLPTITVEAGIPADVTAAQVHSEIRGAVEAMDLPVGYGFEWGGEYENSTEAQASLGQQLPLSFLVMVLISIFLFGRLRQPLVIWLLVPMSVNGVAIGLLGTGLPFTFTALLGLLSLSGMLIKNGIVLVEEIDLVRAEGVEFTQAVVDACVSRVRPVLLAAATTILGMIPLLSDAFFASMAVTIMGGLAFATILTLIAAPVLYSLFLKRSAEKAAAAAPA